MAHEEYDQDQRHFLLFCHNVPEDGEFSLNDLPGSGGRVDIAARCAAAALLLSHGIRRNSSISLLLPMGGEMVRVVSISGRDVKYLNPDERSTAALIRNALVRAERGEYGIASPGIEVTDSTVEEALISISDRRSVYYLKEDGRKSTDFEKNSIFVLSDSIDLFEEEERHVIRMGARKVSLSNRSMHADHCISIVNWLLDLRSENGSISI